MYTDLESRTETRGATAVMCFVTRQAQRAIGQLAGHESDRNGWKTANGLK